MTTLSIKIDADLKQKAQKMASEIGISLSSMIKMLLKDTVRTGKLDIATKPRYHAGPEEGDLDFETGEEAIAYFKKLADEDGKIT